MRSIAERGRLAGDHVASYRVRVRRPHGILGLVWLLLRRRPMLVLGQYRYRCELALSGFGDGTLKLYGDPVAP